MINFDDIKRLIDQLNVHNVRVIDLKDHKIFEYLGTSSIDVINGLEKNLNWLGSYGRCKVLGANESQFKQSWKDCYKWDVVFNNIPAQQNNNNQKPQNNVNQGTGIPTGYVSLEYATMMAQIESLKASNDLKLKEMEWRMQMHSNAQNDPMRFLPMAGMFFNIDDKKMANVMKIAQAQSAMNGNQNTGMAGLGMNNINETKVTIEDQNELVTKIQDELTVLSQKIPLETILKMVKGLNAKPDVKGTVDQLIMFL